MMLKRATAIFSLSYLLLHATLGESNQTSSLHFKSTNTRYSLHLLISLTYKLSNSYLSNFTKIQKLSGGCHPHHFCPDRRRSFRGGLGGPISIFLPLLVLSVSRRFGSLSTSLSPPVVLFCLFGDVLHLWRAF
jgi:hypothetical protein